MKKIVSMLMAFAVIGYFSAASYADWTRTAFITDTKTQAQGQFQVDASYDYAKKDKFFDTKIDAKKNEVLGDVYYGILDNLNVGLTFGWQKYEVSDESESGCTDLWLSTKYLALSEANFPVDWAIGGAVKFATADEDKGLGTGETDYQIFTSVAKTLIPELIAVGELSYTWIGDPDGVDYKDSFGWGAELVYNGLIEKLSLHAAVFGNQDPSRDMISDLKDPIMVGLGAKYYITENVRAGLDVSFGTETKKSYSPDFDIQASVGVLI